MSHFKLVSRLQNNKFFIECLIIFTPHFTLVFEFVVYEKLNVYLAKANERVLRVAEINLLRGRNNYTFYYYIFCIYERKKTTKPNRSRKVRVSSDLFLYSLRYFCNIVVVFVYFHYQSTQLISDIPTITLITNSTLIALRVYTM